MSRYTVPACDPRFTVIVGWDTPLATFFAQVFASEKEEDEDDACCILWIGITPEALGTVEALQVCLQPFAHIAEDVETLLRADQQQHRPWSPLPDMVVQWMSEAPSVFSPAPLAEEEDEKPEDDWEPAYHIAEVDAQHAVHLVRALTNMRAEDQRVFADAIRPYESAVGASLAELWHLTDTAEALLQKYDPSAAHW